MLEAARDPVPIEHLTDCHLASRCGVVNRVPVYRLSKRTPQGLADSARDLLPSSSSEKPGQGRRG